MGLNSTGPQLCTLRWYPCLIYPVSLFWGSDHGLSCYVTNAKIDLIWILYLFPRKVGVNFFSILTLPAVAFGIPNTHYRKVQQKPVISSLPGTDNIDLFRLDSPVLPEFSITGVQTLWSSNPVELGI